MDEWVSGLLVIFICPQVSLSQIPHTKLVFAMNLIQLNEMVVGTLTHKSNTSIPTIVQNEHEVL